MIIGVIGGGQLGMMMAEVALKLGHQIVSLDPNIDCSISRYAVEHIAKDYNDIEALEYMNQRCDVLTYEFENVDLNTLSKYIDKIPQKLDALRISRNRLIEKDYAKSLGIMTPKYSFVKTVSDVFVPSIVKTITGGYDGKGQYRVMDRNDIDQIPLESDNLLICEEFISFDYEISVVATRDRFGKVVTFPIPINTHKNGILHTSLADNNINAKIASKAVTYTERIMEDLNYVGTLAVEYFVKGEEVIFNEFAPRPHNSGHYTMDGCNISQFENHIRAITGEKIIEPKLMSKTLMLNVLGQNIDLYSVLKDYENTVIHDYFKHSDKMNRKIGHINYMFQTEEELMSFITRFTKEI